MKASWGEVSFIVGMFALAVFIMLWVAGLLWN